MADILSPKIPKNFKCECCNYICSNKKDFNKHLMTRKHENTYKGLTNADKKSPKIPNFECDCGNTYKHRQSLYKHQKNCYTYQEENNPNKIPNKIPINNVSINTDIDKELLVKMLLKNQDVMEKMMEIMPQIGNNSHNTNSHNITNNQFNVNMFLNDHCKNAMNLTDFINSLPITNETYDDTIENGLTKTITNMMLTGLNELDILERPIHCTDPARKTMYIKDNDVWEKDTELNLLLENIALLATKHRININKWQDANTGWDKNENLQTKMTTLVFNSMTCIEDDEKEVNKIVRAIGKNTYLSTDIKNEFK